MYTTANENPFGSFTKDKLLEAIDLIKKIGHMPKFRSMKVIAVPDYKVIPLQIGDDHNAYNVMCVLELSGFNNKKEAEDFIERNFRTVTPPALEKE